MGNIVANIVDGGERVNPSSLEQKEPLLQTKLLIPPTRPNLVARPRLNEQLNECLEKALTLVSAPAGYGKTTLVSNWLHGTRIASAWLSLDESDNDPIRFLQYFITALHKLIPTIKVDLLGVLQGMQPAPHRALINVLINEIAGHPAPIILVLDDLHALHAQSVLDLLTYLLEHLPPQMHVVLISRADPPLPLSRMRTRNELIEIRADRLRFFRDEIAIFLNEVMGLEVPANDIASMETRTEGWIAGLQLAALSMKGSHDVHGFIAAFTGSHYYIMDYLIEEVLKIQPERVRSFMLQTSILNRMCGPLCDEILVDQEIRVEGVDEALASTLDSHSVLEALERSNLFLIPLDDKRRWYRYHHLLSDVLKRRMEHQFPHLLPELHRRAAQWYEKNGFIQDAIQHALRAGDRRRAAQLVDQNGCLLLMRGEVVNLLSWIEAVEPASQTYPWIAIQKAWSLCLTGQMEQAEPSLQIADRLISSLETSDAVGTMLGAVAAARAYRANMEEKAHLAVEYARQALDCLPVSSDFSCSLRSAATSLLGDANWMDGNLKEAQLAYTDAVNISKAARSFHMGIIANSNLAEILMEQGQLHQAMKIYTDTLALATLADGQISPLAERVFAGLSRVSYEWNHLEAAAEHVHKCIEYSRRWGSIEFLAIGYTMLARLGHLQGNLEQVEEAIRAVQLLMNEYKLSPLHSIWIKYALVRLWIAQGEFERAADFLYKSGEPIFDPSGDGIHIKDEILYLQAPMILAKLRILLAQGSYEAALQLSEGLLRKEDGRKPTKRVIEILVLQALAFQGKQDMQQAIAALKEALSLAEPEGYMRTFLDEGEAMAALLKVSRLKTGGYIRKYIERLLSAHYGSRPGLELQPPMPPPEALIVALTPREVEVLKLIEAGNSNQDIANKLVISIPTVKRHISNLYAKLGVTNRTQAVSQGRELRLLV